MRVQLFACIALLAAVLVGIKYGISRVLEVWGLGPYVLVCLGGVFIFWFAAHLVDCAEARSRQSQTLTSRDRRP